MRLRRRRSATGNPQVAILLGDGVSGRGVGTFTLGVSYPLGTTALSDIESGDLDGDGIVDLLVADKAQGGRLVLLKGVGIRIRGDATFGAPVPRWLLWWVLGPSRVRRRLLPALHDWLLG